MTFASLSLLISFFPVFLRFLYSFLIWLLFSPFSFSSIFQFGDTPLIFATKENCVEIVLKLIEHGADVNAIDKVRKVQSDNKQLIMNNTADNFQKIIHNVLIHVISSFLSSLVFLSPFHFFPFLLLPLLLSFPVYTFPHPFLFISLILFSRLESHHCL